MQYQKDQKRLQSLYSERLLQIKRQGIRVQLYHTHTILPAYIQCTYADLSKFEAFLDSKTSLELCDLNGIPLRKIDKKSFFLRKNDQNDERRIYLENKSALRHMTQGYVYILVKNNATIGVLSQLLEKRLTGDRYFHKIQDFIGDDKCTKIDLDQQMRLTYENQNDLNEEQNLAIYKAFTNHLTFVKGPPGCGKTKTVSRMVTMLAQRGLKVLVGSISNIANQTLISQIIRQVNLHNYQYRMHPFTKQRKLQLIINYSRKASQRLSQQEMHFSLNYQLFNYILKQNTSELYGEGNIMDYIQRLQEGEVVPNNFYAIYMKCYTKLISETNIVISTTINSFKLYKYTGFRPDVGIIDEAAQASWTDTYGFLAFGVTRIIFVGDQKQLRPIVIGNATSNEILKQTMFEKLSQKNNEYFVLLKRQYRMHPQISQFPNQHIYQQKLIDDQTTSERQCTIDYFRMHPISFVTHKFEEQVYESSQTVDSQKGVKEFYNQYEGSLIMDFLFSIPFEEWKNIGILTFYDMQCQVLIQSLESSVQKFHRSGLTIKTIDGYQGGQKDYILVSTVRSNADKNPGFCTELNRVNVALTRAKKGLIVFGDPQTLNQGKQASDPNLNIWGKFYNFMLSKQQVMAYEKWNELNCKIKQRQTVRGQLYHLYIDSLAILQQWHTFAPSEKDILDNYQTLKQKTKMFTEFALRKGQKSKQLRNSETKANFVEFLCSQQISNEQNSQKQIQQLIQEGFTIVKQQSLKQKVHQLLTQFFTQKENEFTYYFIHLISTDVYQIISQPHSLSQCEQLVSLLGSKITEQEHKLIQSAEIALGEFINSSKSKSLSIQKETQLTNTLVSSKLMCSLVSLFKKEISPLVAQQHATSSN